MTTTPITPEKTKADAEEERRILCSKIRRIVSESSYSPSLFADTVDVPRSSISHILSERNKPSLEIVDRILKTFPKVTYEWLMNGNEHDPLPDGAIHRAPSEENKEQKDQEINAPKTDFQSSKSSNKKLLARSLKDSHREIPQPEFSGYSSKKAKRALRVAVFYDDHSWQDLSPETLETLHRFNII
jgi:DNA-binding XRE family transcriptional regulator